MRNTTATSFGLIAFSIAAMSLVTLRAQVRILTEIALAGAAGLPDTSPVPGGGGPEAVESDGTSVWVAEQFTNRVSRLDALTGLPLGSFAVGKRPVALLRIG